MALAADFTVIRPNGPTVGTAEAGAGHTGNGFGGSIYGARFDAGGVNGSEVAMLMLHVSGPSNATKGARILVNGRHVGTIAPWTADRAAAPRSYAFSFSGRLLRDIGNRIQIVDAVGRVIEPDVDASRFAVLEAICFYRQTAS
jgi:hypothetical protein